MSPRVTVSTITTAPKEVVWEMLADFNNIADYTDSVKTSEATSEGEIAVGSTRHCTLAPIGTTEERITEFVPGERLGIHLYDMKGIPVKHTDSVFSVEEVDGGTRITFDSDVKPKGGVFAGFVGKRLEKRLPKGAQRMVDDLGASAERLVAERS